MEQKLKMASAAGQQRTLKVNFAQTEAEKTDHAVTKRKPKTDSDQSVNERLLAEIQEIKTDINHLKDQVREKQQANRYRKPLRMSRPWGGPTVPRGCKQCQSQGNPDCRHCFKCGACGHVRASCWKTDQSRNQNWLSQRDKRLLEMKISPNLNVTSAEGQVWAVPYGNVKGVRL